MVWRRPLNEGLRGKRLYAVMRPLQCVTQGKDRCAGSNSRFSNEQSAIAFRGGEMTTNVVGFVEEDTLKDKLETLLE